MGKKTNTSELIGSIAEATGRSMADVKAVLDGMTAAITAELAAGNAVAVTDLGVFKPSHRAARAGRNPKTGETIQIAASNGAGFSAAKALKDALN